jgi:hypothetical protein
VDLRALAGNCAPCCCTEVLRHFAQQPRVYACHFYPESEAKMQGAHILCGWPAGLDGRVKLPCGVSRTPSVDHFIFQTSTGCDSLIQNPYV